MEVQPDLHFIPVEGETIPDSTLRKLGLLAMDTFFLIPFCGLSVWARWNNIVFLNKQITWGWGVVALVFLIAGILVWPILVYSLFQRKRLIFGTDLLQILNGQKVEQQIPYRNIARLEMAKYKDKGECIFIDLLNLEDPETLFRGSVAYKRMTGWHYIFERDSWKLPIPAIYASLSRHLKRAEHNGMK
jgi:hypothetical protein